MSLHSPLTKKNVCELRWGCRVLTYLWYDRGGSQAASQVRKDPEQGGRGTFVPYTARAPPPRQASSVGGRKPAGSSIRVTGNSGFVGHFSQIFIQHSIKLIGLGALIVSNAFINNTIKQSRSVNFLIL